MRSNINYCFPLDAHVSAGARLGCTARGRYSAAMTDRPADKPLVLRSIETADGARCVDIFRRPDGSFGFETYRRDAEDSAGWFAIGHHAGTRYASAEAALAAARAAVPWLTGLAGG